MTLRLRAHGLLSCLLTVALAASCLFAVPAHAAGLLQPEADLDGLTLDQRFSELAAQIPGFAGYYYDADGVLTVQLKDPSQLSEFRTEEPFQIVQADYDFFELQAAAEALEQSALDLAGVVYTDIDEARNRFVIAVDSAEAAEKVEGLLETTAVQRDAVRVELTEPIHFAKTLRDKFTKPRGGIQIQFSNFYCTLGFNVRRNGVRGFITNSHCTDNQGGSEDTRYYQPTNATGWIATEKADPTYFTGGACPSSRRCRYSDSAFAKYRASVTDNLSRVARTTSSGQYSGSLTINSSPAQFKIVGENAAASVGQRMHKVGRTTGWTRGDVTFTCATVNVAGSNKTLLCQNGVDAGVGGGDSGSPVFTRSGNDIRLRGILWGGSSDGRLFVYSPINLIEQELGALRTF